MSQLQLVQDLYDRHRFLAAYRESAEYWKPSTDLPTLSPDELILGGRLAARLGGVRLSRWLFRAAYARNPSNPRVQYFSASCRPEHRSPVDYLRMFEQQPDLGGEDGEVRASWLASQAATWASLRDFARAGECLERAHAVNANDAWVWSCESHVRGLADRWADALKCAERAWELNPGAPYAAQSLATSLINLGRVAESAARLSAASESAESYEVVGLACWHQCALAETLDGAERRQVLERAHALADRLPALAPLADREVQPQLARARLDVAALMGARDEIEKYAKEVKSPFYRRVLNNLQKNGEERRTVLPFHRAIQKYEACLPASISSALVSMNTAVDADAMASEITFGGTPLWAAADWLAARGLEVRFFAARPAVAASLIKDGTAFVLTTETDETGHAVAVVGLDESAGTLLVHDPQSFRTTEYLLDGLAEVKLPLGPKGMAVAPGEKAALLDRLLSPEDVEVMTASHRHQKAVTVSGPSAARAVVEILSAEHPQHAGTRWLRAVQALEDGHTSEALADFQHLLNEFPGCTYVRRNLVTACRLLGNTALMRGVLANVVDAGRLPGIHSNQVWRYPPSGYVSEYADLLRLSAGSRQEAHRLLKRVLRREGTFAPAWHVLGDFLWHEHDTAGALLAYRLASCLASSNDHFARGYSDALRSAGREAEGLAWLETRVRSLGPSSHAAGPWIAWISALEDYGYPEPALAACHDALEGHADASELMAFAVPFFARMGHWEEAEQGLRRLEATGHTPRYYQAAMDYHRMRGDLDTAVGLAEQWVRESPQSLPARQQLSELTSKRQGSRAALDLARQWSRQNPGHEQLEEIYCRQLERAEGKWKEDLLLRRRVKRNPEDGWAWRELAFRRLADYDNANEKRRAKLAPRITALLAECDRTAPEAPATLRAHAEWLTVRGERPQAVVAWLEAIDAEPECFHSYRRIWDCSATLGGPERRALLEQIEGMFLDQPGRLPNARDLIFLIAERFGASRAEEVAMRWKTRRAEEPELVEAAADLLLAEGHGRADAARAREMLEPAVARFPYFAGLRLSLADAYRKTGNPARAEECLQEVILRHPSHTGTHIQLAWVHQGRGNGEEALRLLEASASRDPLSAGVWDARARILIHNRRFADARAVLQEGLEKLADSVQFRELAIQRLIECSDEEGAVAAAREGVRIYPRGAYMWHLLGTTLEKNSHLAAPGEIESCFRRSLEQNCSLFAAADSLATLLVQGGRHEEAADLMRAILPRLDDPCPARGRLAWIERQAAKKAEALEEITAAVRAAPWYRWGWATAMDWLVEDQAWDKARSLLLPSPPEFRTEIRLRSRRLTVLQAAGLPAAEIDAEWDALLKDFPDNISLHLQRYDRLREGKRNSEAAAVLEPLELAAPDNPWMLARLVEVLAEQQKKAEAVDTLLRIWFSEGEGFDWAADYAWKAIERAQLGDECCRQARQRLEQGARPSRSAFAILVKHTQPAAAKKKSHQPFWRVWFPSAGAREALALLDLVHDAAWNDGSYEAIVFESLTNFGYERLVVNRWKKGRTRADSEVYSWSEVGRALIGLGRTQEARRLLSGWRERPGVKMWMVTNYALGAPRRGREDWEEIRSVCQDALAVLPHDHCAKYLAHVQAEMCACLDDAEALRQTWTKHRDYFSGKLAKGEWFEERRKHLLGDIPCAARLLEQNQTKLFRKACRDLRGKRDGVAKRKVRSLGGLPWWIWWLLILALQGLLNVRRH